MTVFSRCASLLYNIDRAGRAQAVTAAFLAINGQLVWGTGFAFDYGSEAALALYPAVGTGLVVVTASECIPVVIFRPLRFIQGYCATDPVARVFDLGSHVIRKVSA